MPQQHLVPTCPTCQNQDFDCYRCGTRTIGIGLTLQEPVQPPRAAVPPPTTPETFLEFLRQPGARWRYTLERKPGSGVQFLDLRFHAPAPVDEAHALVRTAVTARWMPVFANYRLSAGPVEIMHIQFIAEV
jgi:hypothetical protein